MAQLASVGDFSPNPDCAAYTAHEWAVGSQDACAWEDVVYNFTRPVKTLRQQIDTNGKRWRQQSPAMAAGLTNHIWSTRDLLNLPISIRFLFNLIFHSPQKWI